MFFDKLFDLVFIFAIEKMYKRSLFLVESINYFVIIFRFKLLYLVDVF